MIGGIIVPYIYDNYSQAIELCWWVDEDVRHTGLGKELLQAFEDWAKEEGCKYITMISLAAPNQEHDQVGKVYEKLGYSLMERTYMKEIP
jgi:GNAT superfamily N-acetyltransferase